jgi:hypothetical protein
VVRLRLTLIEHLVVLAIAAILLGLAMPSISGGPRGRAGWACLLLPAGIMLFSVASVLARLLLAVLQRIVRDR